MRSRRQTLSQGPVPRKPRSYLSRRKHSVAPHRRGSRQPSLVSEDRRSLCPRARRFCRDGCLRVHCLLPRADRNPSSKEVRHLTLALLRLTSLPSGSLLEHISADAVTLSPPPPAPATRKEVRMDTS